MNEVDAGGWINLLASQSLFPSDHVGRGSLGSKIFHPNKFLTGHRITGFVNNLKVELKFFALEVLGHSSSLLMPAPECWRAYARPHQLTL